MVHDAALQRTVDNNLIHDAALLNELLRLEELAQIKDLPGGKTEKAHHRQNAEVKHF